MDLWPVINGKCLLKGINLKTTEASDMMDIVHVLYEEDAIPLFEEHQKIKSQVRTAMWHHLLGKDYKHAYTEGGSSEPPDAYPPGELPPEESLLPDPDAPKAVKPYVPPTDFSQFEEVGLDAPMGGIEPWQ